MGFDQRIQEPIDKCRGVVFVNEIAAKLVSAVDYFMAIEASVNDRQISDLGARAFAKYWKVRADSGVFRRASMVWKQARNPRGARLSCR